MDSVLMFFISATGSASQVGDSWADVFDDTAETDNTDTDQSALHLYGEHIDDSDTNLIDDTQLVVHHYHAHCGL